MKLFDITFSDGTKWSGGSIENSEWNEIIKPIKELTYTVNGKSVYLEEFESYNHLKVTKSILNTGKSIITDMIVMGKTKNNIKIFTYNFIKEEFTESCSAIGKEFKERPTSGWKEGLLNNPQQ